MSRCATIRLIGHSGFGILHAQGSSTTFSCLHLPASGSYATHPVDLLPAESVRTSIKKSAPATNSGSKPKIASRELSVK